jgi:hypothetical protein
MDERAELAAALMAEVTGRLETLAGLASGQQVASQLDPEAILEIRMQLGDTLVVLNACQILLNSKREGMRL